MKKRILSFILAVIITAGIIPLSAIGTFAAENPKYQECTSGMYGVFEEKTMPDGYIPLSEASLGYPMTMGSEGSATWYYADTDKTYISTVHAAGDVHIVLKDGVTVTFNGGLVTSGDGSISIYAQSFMPYTMGTVVAAGIDSSAAIGSNYNQRGGTVNIHGGNINAAAEEDAPAIGAGLLSSDFTVNIYGGFIDATGKGCAAGIGTGELCENVSVNIYGSYITAEGGTSSEDGEETEYPAIGAGKQGECTVDGGLCHFNYYKGRGTGTKANTFEGLHCVTMVRSDTERHLVKTHYPETGATVFEDGTVNTPGHKEYFECYCGSYFEDGECFNKISNLSAWKAGEGKILVPGDVTVTFNLNYSAENRIYSTETLTPPSVCTCPEKPVREGYSFGGWYKYPGCQDGDRFDFSQKITEDTTLYAKWVDGGYYHHKFGQTELSFDVLPDNLISLTSSMTTLGKDGEGTWYFADTSFEMNTRLTVQGNVHIILKNGVTVNFKKGIGVDKSYRGIDIYAQSINPEVAGTLIATGSNQSAGIGSGNETDCGIITIHSGNVIATGAQYGAGIGGGDTNRGGVVQIYGGNITAKGGEKGAGIGTGDKSANGFEIIIAGGTINATGGANAAGIGGGNNAKNVSVEISEGIISTQGGTNGAGIGSGNSGSEVTVYITGGYINEAIGGKNGAGIGSGASASAMVEVNCNRSITAQGGASGAGIGSGYKGSATVEILSLENSRFTGGEYSNGSQYAKGVGKGESASCDLKIAECVLTIRDSVNGMQWVDRIPNGYHTFKAVIPATPPLYDEDGIGILESGTREYYQCQCGFYFSDRECTKLIGGTVELENWKGNEGVDNDTYGVYFNWQRNSKVTAVAVKPGSKVQPIWPGDGGSYVVGWYTDTSCTAGNEFDFSQPVNERVTQLYAKWVDNCYLDYDEASHELIPKEIPKNIKKVTYSGSGDLNLGEFSLETGISEEEQWYYVQGKIIVDGRINVYGDVHLILYDGSLLQGNCVNGMIDGGLSLYGQSKDKQTMGKLISGMEEEYGINMANDFNVHGGKVEIKGGNTSSPVAFTIKAENINIYGGSLDLKGTNYISVISGHIYEIQTAALTGNLHIDTCMLDVYAVEGDGDRLFSNYGSAHILKTEMKSARVHTPARTTKEILPYIDTDGNIVDGICAYYTCGCGYNYSDEELTQRIADIDRWKNGSGKLVGRKVTFDLGYDGETTAVAVAGGRAVTKPADPERELYDFLGWFDGSGNEWDFDTTITKDTTLYADWKVSHVHVWSPEWSFDGTYHWHECEADDCPVKETERMDSYGTHNLVGFACTVCGWEDLANAKLYASDVINVEAERCPSEVHKSEVAELADAAKCSIENAKNLDEIYSILDEFNESAVALYTVTYYDEKGSEQTLSDYVPLKDSEETVVTLNANEWYVAEKSIDITKPVIVEGDVHIVLCDGVTFNAAKGIAVTEENSLTVYSESLSENMGKLAASGRMGCAGIGGYTDTMNEIIFNAGDITINGGEITATGGFGAAGIGGGFGGNGGKVTVNNGIVTATAGLGAVAGQGGAGIGGGYNGTDGTIEINNVKKLKAVGFRGIGAGQEKANTGLTTVAKCLTIKSGADESSAKKSPIITEEAYIEITPYVEPVIFETMSLTLDGAIGVNFYVQINDMDYVGDNAYMTMEFDNFGEKKTEKVDLGPDYYDETKGKYKFTFYVNSLQMAEDINATFYYGDGEYIARSTSVKDYAETLIGKSTNTKSVELAKAILAYGYWAQLALQETHKFTLGTDGKYDAMPVPENTPNTSIDLSEYALAAGGKNDSIEALSMSLALDNRTDIYLYVTTDAEPTVTGADVEIVKVGDRYRITIPNIAAHELTTTYSLDIGGLTVDVSAFSYINSVLNSETRSENYKKAVAALYEYYTAAVAYAK